jgi:sugar phosphate isomerase/epimerase
VTDPDGLSDEALAEMRRLACPQLRVTLDTATTPGGAERFASLADVLGNVYLRDVRRSGGQFEEVAYGQGEVDFAGLLAQVAAARPDAALVLRRDGPGGVDALREGREYIRSLLEQFR